MSDSNVSSRLEPGVHENVGGRDSGSGRSADGRAPGSGVPKPHIRPERNEQKMVIAAVDSLRRWGTRPIERDHAYDVIIAATARLQEQYQALHDAAVAVVDARSYVSIDGRTVLADESLAEQVDALREVLYPASSRETSPTNGEEQR